MIPELIRSLPINNVLESKLMLCRLPISHEVTDKWALWWATEAHIDEAT